MNNLYKFLPVSYTVYSRISGKKELLSWIYLFPAYCMLLTFIFGPADDWVIFPFVFFAIISLYEIGYLFNDAKSIKNESNPTKRINDSWIFHNFNKLVVVRIIYILFFLFLIYHYDNGILFYRFLGFLFFLGFAFYIHNKLRGKINVLTFCILSSAKYAATLMLIDDLVVFYMTFAAFPLLRTIEYCSIKGYCKNIGFIAGHLHEFRVVYYSLFFFISVLLLLLDVLNTSYLLIPFYFMIFRILVLMYSRGISK